MFRALMVYCLAVACWRAATEPAPVSYLLPGGTRITFYYGEAQRRRAVQRMMWSLSA